MSDEIDLKKFSKDNVMTVTVNVTNEFKVRVWLGIRLIALASCVMGMGFEFVEEDDDA